MCFRINAKHQTQLKPEYTPILGVDSLSYHWGQLEGLDLVLIERKQLWKIYSGPGHPSNILGVERNSTDYSISSTVKARLATIAPLSVADAKAGFAAFADPGLSRHTEDGDAATEVDDESDSDDENWWRKTDQFMSKVGNKAVEVLVAENKVEDMTQGYSLVHAAHARLYKTWSASSQQVYTIGSSCNGVYHVVTEKKGVFTCSVPCKRKSCHHRLAVWMMMVVLGTI